ncbi:MAG TPA: MGMT family protein [Pyrinomonadaceae bacterium]|jgi:methylated-DNA-protein-cysteine methyltransferase-like protein
MANSRRQTNSQKPLTKSGETEASQQSESDPRAAQEQQLDVDSPAYRERVYRLVRRIPPGRVMTYGQIAELLGEGYTPRTVGFVMHAADEQRDPWHRVINAQGACSTGRLLLPHNKQQLMLEAEGVEFDARGRCDLKRYRWTPEEAEGAGGTEEDAQPSLFAD